MEERPVYLDHNATTPVLPEVVEAMLPYLREHFGNPSSTHPYGRRAHAVVELAREQVAALIGARPEEIVFTSGGTESNNLAIRGVTASRSARKHVVTSAIEHPAVTQPCRHLEREGWRISWLAVDGSGTVLLEKAQEAIGPETALVTVMHANNETGTLQPIRELSVMAKKVGALIHTDAAQSVGKVQVDVDDLGVDLLTIAGHKLYAPKGVGALYVRAGTELVPLVLGAGHEGGLRPGTENVPYIAGLGKACEIARQGLAKEAQRVRSLRDELWTLLRAEVHGIRLNGHPTDRLPNTLNVSFPGVLGSAVLAAALQVAASTGSACHEGGDETPSAVLLAMGMEARIALGAVRLSLGRGTTEAHVRRAARALILAWQELSVPVPS
jgi:cysteine desulfurase